ncbi:MAG: hypothetical protein NTV70_17950 [Acidobacteria bacterium]|nr:hypothetical protein [Acidobacteriota bacterium]
MIPLLMMTLALEPTPPLAVGEPLPTLTGEYLTKRKASLPGDAHGKVALLLMGFSYNSRFPVERFAKEFEKAFPASPGITFFEVPLIGGMARMAAPFIDSGMRRGTPRAKHENVITVYGGVGPWKQRLSVRREEDAHLVLIDPQGIVRWIYRGGYDEPALKQLIEETRKLAPE